MEGPACTTCPFWSRFPDRIEFRWSDEAGEQLEVRTSNEKGECRRYPPRVPRDFPLTAPDDWCGEHPERHPRDDG